MKKMTKILLATGAALVLTGGAVTNFLIAQQKAVVPQDDLTLANVEALAAIPDEMGEGKYDYGPNQDFKCIIMVGTQPVNGYKPMCFVGSKYPVCADCVAL